MGQKVRTLAEQRRFVLRRSQVEIARRLSTTQGQVSKVERGHRPDPIRSHWEDWAEAYGVTMKRFLELCEGSKAGGFELPLWDLVETTGGTVVQASATPKLKERMA
jgi:transcriptional regulator with XRE-family HTH domain